MRSISQGIILTKFHLAFIYTMLSWPIIYILIFVTQPEYLLPNGGYISTFGSGSGTAINTGKGNLNNTLLTDLGRETILWISLLFSLLVGLIVYYLLFY